MEQMRAFYDAAVARAETAINHVPDAGAAYLDLVDKPVP